MFKNILAALDDSPRAPHVLRQAAELAARVGAVLHLCRAVVVPSGVPTDALILTSDVLAANLIDRSNRELATLAQSLHPGHTPIVWGERVCRIGSPGQVVVDVAAELHMDLIVAGSHGYRILDRILGTTAARIVNHAHCSVLIVRGA